MPLSTAELDRDVHTSIDEAVHTLFSPPSGELDGSSRAQHLQKVGVRVPSLEPARWCSEWFHRVAADCAARSGSRSGSLRISAAGRSAARRKGAAACRGSSVGRVEGALDARSCTRADISKRRRRRFDLRSKRSGGGSGADLRAFRFGPSGRIFIVRLILRAGRHRRSF